LRTREKIVQKKPDHSFSLRLKTLPNFGYVHDVDNLVRDFGEGLDLLHIIIERQYLTKDDACRCYAESLGFAYVDPFSSIMTDSAVAAIPVEIAQKAGVIGIYIIEGVLTASMSKPEDENLVRRLSQIAKMPVSPVFALPSEIEHAILIQYSSEENLSESLSALARSNIFENPDLATDKLAAIADTAELISILEEIIYYAIRERATDIHIEPQETSSRVRFRIDGMLREILCFSRKLHRSFISRLKILSNLNIAESRFPQDGRFSIGIAQNKADFRFSSIPTQYGEKAVVRILPSSTKKSMITLDKMMMSQSILGPLQHLIRNPNGIIFVTGPTGSGKTTTLYAALNEINTPDVNISTIEDPVEIQLPGVTQTQVNANIDLKFSTVLRSLLRQDPDVILIGEIRDLETAKIATEAALTGHIVFATLHTNTAAQAIIRLMDIGVDAFMVAPAVIGVLAQRLVGRICESCKEAYIPSPDVLDKYFKDEGRELVHFFRGKGCTVCRGTGYKGRIAFHELVIITEEVRTLITQRAPVYEITIAAAKVALAAISEVKSSL
jgi:type IV pilus assembly protein PilB